MFITIYIHIWCRTTNTMPTRIVFVDTHFMAGSSSVVLVTKTRTKFTGAYADFLKGGLLCDHTQTTPTY